MPMPLREGDLVRVGDGPPANPRHYRRGQTGTVVAVSWHIPQPKRPGLVPAPPRATCWVVYADSIRNFFMQDNLTLVRRNDEGKS